MQVSPGRNAFAQKRKINYLLQADENISFALEDVTVQHTKRAQMF